MEESAAAAGAGGGWVGDVVKVNAVTAGKGAREVAVEDRWFVAEGVGARYGAGGYIRGVPELVVGDDEEGGVRVSKTSGEVLSDAVDAVHSWCQKNPIFLITTYAFLSLTLDLSAVSRCLVHVQEP